MAAVAAARGQSDLGTGRAPAGWASVGLALSVVALYRRAPTRAALAPADLVT
jgi:hypothetical protein